MEKNFSPADYLALAEHEIDLNTVAAQYTYIKNIVLHITIEFFVIWIYFLY